MSPKTLLMLLSFSVLFTQCKKDDDDTDNGNDLTVEVVGKYINTAEEFEITVTKVDNSTVSIFLDDIYLYEQEDFAFPTVKMTNTTAFTVSEITKDGTFCNGQEKVTGTGSASNNNITLFLTVTGLGDCSNRTLNFAASK